MSIGDFVLALLFVLLMGVPRIVHKQRMVEADDKEFDRMWTGLPPEEQLRQAERMTAYHIGLRAWLAIWMNFFVAGGVAFLWWRKMNLPPSFGTFISCMVTFFAMVVILKMEPQRIKRAARACQLEVDLFSEGCVDAGFAVAIGVSLLVRLALTDVVTIVMACEAIAIGTGVFLWGLQRRKFAFAATIPHVLS